MKPAASIVVSGFGVREASWDRLRSCLESIARQEVFSSHEFGPVEVVLVAMAGLPGEFSSEMHEILPNLQLISCSNPDPWARKTAGVQSATAPIVAFVDADCMPQTGWLQSMLEAFQFFPEVAVVRGTENPSWWQQLLPLRREAGPVRSSAANNVAFRREAYLDCPFPEASGAKAVSLQSLALRRAHYVLWAEPAMRIIHDRRGLKQALGVQVDYSPAATR